VNSSPSATSTSTARCPIAATWRVSTPRKTREERSSSTRCASPVVGGGPIDSTASSDDFARRAARSSSRGPSSEIDRLIALVGSTDKSISLPDAVACVEPRCIERRGPTLPPICDSGTLVLLSKASAAVLPPNWEPTEPYWDADASTAATGLALRCACLVRARAWMSWAAPPRPVATESQPQSPPKSWPSGSPLSLKYWTIHGLEGTPPGGSRRSRTCAASLSFLSSATASFSSGITSEESFGGSVVSSTSSAAETALTSSLRRARHAAYTFEGAMPPPTGDAHSIESLKRRSRCRYSRSRV